MKSLSLQERENDMNIIMVDYIANYMNMVMDDYKFSLHENIILKDFLVEQRN
jgi:hypothetical protein